MINYKLVPVEPTPEMLEAGEYAQYTGCYVSGIYADMIAAAPAVQGEPVGYVSPRLLDALLSGKACGITMEDKLDARNGVTIPLFAAPQPAEQQPDRGVRMLAASLYQACGAYDMPTRVLDVLSAAANGEPFAHMIDGLLPCVPPSDQNVQGDPVGAEQQPLPCQERGGDGAGGEHEEDCAMAQPDGDAVDRFAAAMKAKLNKKRQEGRGGWQSMTAEQLSTLLHEHVHKGDPVDVANLAMMLHQNGQRIEQQPAPDVARLVEALELIEKGEDTGPDGWGAFRWADCRNIARAALADHRKQGGEV